MSIQDQDYVDVPTPTGPMRVHRFMPKGVGPRPAVILYSEIYQVTGPIRRLGVETKRTTNVGSFSSGQQEFLDYHRNYVLLKAQVRSVQTATQV